MIVLIWLRFGDMSSKCIMLQSFNNRSWSIFIPNISVCPNNAVKFMFMLSSRYLRIDLFFSWIYFIFFLASHLSANVQWVSAKTEKKRNKTKNIFLICNLLLQLMYVLLCICESESESFFSLHRSSCLYNILYWKLRVILSERTEIITNMKHEKTEED